MKLLVTGATGFIGRGFVDLALEHEAQVLALTRRRPQPPLPCPFLIPSDWDNVALLAKAMEGCDAVLHAAGLAHGQTGDMTYTNVRLTRALAEAARQAHVKRFVFLSSAAVFGRPGIYDADDAPCPHNTYGQSKWEAEQAIQTILAGSQTRFSIVRPPMVLGQSAPGRSETVRKFARLGLPLPLGALPAKRSFIHIRDLALLLWAEAQANGPSALIHPDNRVESASGILREIARLDGLKLSLFPFPASFFKLAAFLMPPLREKIGPLLETHILISGRTNLDHIV